MKGIFRGGKANSVLLVCHGTDALRFPDDFKKQTQKQRICIGPDEVSNDVVFIGHGCPITILFLNGLFQLLLVIGWMMVHCEILVQCGWEAC